MDTKRTLLFQDDNGERFNCMKCVIFGDQLGAMGFGCAVHVDAQDQFKPHDKSAALKQLHQCLKSDLKEGSYEHNLQTQLSNSMENFIHKVGAGKSCTVMYSHINKVHVVVDNDESVPVENKLQQVFLHDSFSAVHPVCD